MRRPLPDALVAAARRFGRNARALLGRTVGARVADDRGSTFVLTIGFSALALALILGVAAATSLYIERRQLLSLADGAALAGAETFALDSVSVTDDQIAPVLTDHDVWIAASAYLDAAPTPLHDVVLVDASSGDGASATVTVASVWSPPVLSLFFPEGFPIQVTVTSRSVFSW